MALIISRPLRIFTAIFQPFIVVLNAASNAMLRMVGINANQVSEDEGSSPDGLKRIIAESYTGGKLDPGEAGMLSGVFPARAGARQVMTPIPAVVTVDTSEDVETALRLASPRATPAWSSPRTEPGPRARPRPRQRAGAQAHERGAAGVAGRHRPAGPDHPETKPLDDLLADLQRQRATMAVVVMRTAAWPGS